MTDLRKAFGRSASYVRGSSDKLHMDSNCFRTVFTVSNFLTDSSNLFDQVRFYPSGTIVLFLNLFVFELVLAIIL